MEAYTAIDYCIYIERYLYFKIEASHMHILKAVHKYGTTDLIIELPKSFT